MHAFSQFRANRDANHPTPVKHRRRDVGFTGPMRPDHGRTIWGEIGKPGYGLYDRALGATYLNGIWEALTSVMPGNVV